MSEKENRQFVWPDGKAATHDELLSIWQMYYTEQTHRDTLFWKQMFTYFYAVLTVMALPYIETFGLKLPTGIPNWMFPSIGILMSVLFLLVAKAYRRRLKSVQDICNTIIAAMPEHLRRDSISAESENKGAYLQRFYKTPMAEVISYAMFGLLIIVGFLLLVTSIF